MSARVPRRVARALLALPAAPAIWLERTRGRKRLALVGLYLVVAAALGLVVYRWTSLQRIPNAPEPFGADVPAAWRVPDDQNALLSYQRAAARLRPVPMVANDTRLLKSAQRALAVWTQTWAEVPRDLRDWLDANREALDAWREGAARPRAVDLALLAPADAPRFDWSPFLNWYGFPPLARLAAARCEAQGDLAGAWAWYHTLLRSTRQLAQCNPIGLSYGEFTVGKDLGPAIERWAADPRADAKLLRQAMADIDALDDLPDNEEPAFWAIYRNTQLRLDEPWPVIWESAHNDLVTSRGEGDWTSSLPGAASLYWFLKNEPERSRRVERLIFANWLKYIRTPRRRRGEWIARSGIVRSNARGDNSSLTLFERPRAGGTPLGPAPLVGWYASTVLLKQRQIEIFGVVHTDATTRAAQRRLIVTLITEIELRERKAAPDEISDELMERYLREVRPGR